MDNLMDLHVKISKLQEQRKQLIKTKMKDKGCSQRWLAEKAEITTSKLNAWINSVNELEPNEIKRINVVLSN